MATILEKIIATKRKEIAQSKDALRADQLRAAIKDAPEPRNFHASLAATEGVALIAEIKKASPSAGVLRDDFDPEQIPYGLGSSDPKPSQRGTRSVRKSFRTELAGSF